MTFLAAKLRDTWTDHLVRRCAKRVCRAIVKNDDAYVAALLSALPSPLTTGQCDLLSPALSLAVTAERLDAARLLVNHGVSPLNWSTDVRFPHTFLCITGQAILVGLSKVHPDGCNVQMSNTAWPGMETLPQHDQQMIKMLAEGSVRPGVVDLMSALQTCGPIGLAVSDDIMRWIMAQACHDQAAVLRTEVGHLGSSAPSRRM